MHFYVTLQQSYIIIIIIIDTNLIYKSRSKQAQPRFRISSSSLKQHRLLRHIMPNNRPRLVLPSSTDHTRRDAPNRNTSLPILDLVKQPIILAMGNRVFPRRWLDRPHGASIARLRHYARSVATARLILRRVLRHRVVVGVVMGSRLMGSRAVGVLRSG
jgi:hypothetical protein